MGFIAVRCPNCGANIDIDDKRDFGFCTYCGTKVEREKQIVELKGKISVDGISGADALLERAQIILKDRDFETAIIYFNRVLELLPRCSSAYWGKMLAENKCSCDNEAVKKMIDISQNFNYQRAVEFANDEQLKIYFDFRERLKAEIEQYNDKIAKLKKLCQTLIISNIVKFIVSLSFNSALMLIFIVLELFYLIAIISIIFKSNIRDLGLKKTRNTYITLTFLFSFICFIISLSR